MNQSKDYWETYYKKNRESTENSVFSQFITPFLESGKRMIELGCGNAKDCKYFSKIGVNVLAIDQCEQEIGFLTKKSKKNPRLDFLAADMTNLPKLEKSDYLYSRFTIHAIDQEGEEDLLRWANQNLKRNGMFFIEARGIKDELYGQGQPLENNAFFTDHYRRFLVLSEFSARLQKYGFNIIYKLEATDLAQYGESNPEVIRIIAQNT